MSLVCVDAPWNAEQIEFLTEWQTGGRIHPYTCGRCRDLLDVEGVLVPESDGWHCPTCPPDDNPVQTWALLPADGDTPSTSQHVAYRCVTCLEEHDLPVRPSPTPGLVIARSTDSACRSPDDPVGVAWNVTHAVSGCMLPAWFGSLEAAMAAADRLRGVWDWTQRAVPSQEAQRATMAVLYEFGGDATHRWYVSDPRDWPS